MAGPGQGHRGARLAQVPAAAGSIDVMVLEASNDQPWGIDASLGSLPHLRRAPFALFKRIKRLGATSGALTATASTLALPDGGSAVVRSVGRRPNGKLQVTVNLTARGSTSNLEF